MTFPTIPTTGAGRVLTNTQANTTATRTFPSLSGLTKNSGDLLIAIVVAYQTSTGTNAAFSGWTGGFSEFHDSATSTTMAIGLAYKWSTGSETGTFAVTQAGTITGHAAMIVLSIPGAHLSTPPEAGGRASGTSAAANPGSLNPAGWGTEDTLWICVGGSGETSTSGAFQGLAGAGGGNPTNYGDNIATGISADVVGGVEGGAYFRQLNAASEDVGAISPDTSNARNAAVVIAVRPAVEAFTGTISELLDDIASVASGTVAEPGVTGTISETLDDITGTADAFQAGQWTSIVSETTEAEDAFTGTIAETLDDITSVASGTSVPPAITGAIAETLDDITSVASGTSTPPPRTGTISETLDPITSVASGTVAPPARTGTIAETLDDITSVASGTSAPPARTGTIAETLDDITAIASGTSTPPAVTGTITETLDAIASVASGTVTSAGFAGAITETLDDITSVASGRLGYSGSISETLDDISGAASGSLGYTGSSSSTLDDVTADADGRSGGQWASASATTDSGVAGTISTVLDDITGTASGTVGAGVPSRTGTISETLDDVAGVITALIGGQWTSVVSESTEVGVAISGSLSETLDDIEGLVLSFGGGQWSVEASATTEAGGYAGTILPAFPSYENAYRGQPSIEDITMVASGTLDIDPGRAGSISETLDPITAAGSGFVGFAGVIALVLEPVTSSIAALFVPSTDPPTGPTTDDQGITTDGGAVGSTRDRGRYGSSADRGRGGSTRDRGAQGYTE
jgi:hypothetical protein